MLTKSRTFIVTGAAGFIGSAICRRLLQHNDVEKVIGMDSLTTYYPLKIKRARVASLLRDPRFIFSRCSITHQKNIRILVKEFSPKVLIHTAAEVGVRSGESNALDYLRTNILGTAMLLEELKNTIASAIIFSSSSVYGNLKKVPFTESQDITRVTPISTYGISKAGMESIVTDYYRRTHIPIVLVRPFSVYGPDGRPDMLPMKLILSAEKQKSLEIYGLSEVQRDWTYIDDLVSCIDQIIRLQSEEIRVVNIGSGRPVSLKKVLQIASGLLKKHGLKLSIVQKPLKSIEMPITYANIHVARSQFMWKPFTDFETGFNNMLNYYVQHKKLYL